MVHGGRRAALVGWALVAAACGRDSTVATAGQPADPSTSTTLAAPTVTRPLPKGTGPVGRVVDVDGKPLAGATVTLYAGPGPKGAFTPVPSGAAFLNPAMRTNPLVTGEDGRFAWDALAGFYEVKATRPGCISELGDPEVSTGWFRLSPSDADYESELVLDCRPPDANPPKIVITRRPPASSTQRDVRVDFTIVDDQPGSAAICAFDDEGPSLKADGGWDPAPPDPCTSPFVRTGVPPGPHRLVILAVDAHGNPAAEEITFTIR